MLTVNEVKLMLRRLAGMIRMATLINGTGAVQFEGAGLNDLVVDSDGYTGLVPMVYQIRVSATGTPDSFRYSSDNGATWAAGANISTSKVTLSNGIGVKWLATTGHTLGETWTVVIAPNFAIDRIRDVVKVSNDIEVLYDLVQPVYTAGKSVDTYLTKYKTDIKAILTALSNALGVSLNAYLQTNTLFVNHDIIDQALATISAAYVIPAQTVLGTVTFTGVDTYTYSAGATIDTTKYNGGQIELYTLSAVTDSGTDGITGITGVNAAGTAVEETVEVAFGGSLTQYATLDLTSGYSQRFKSISAVTVTGGAAGQKFVIRTKEDWMPLV